MQFHAAKPPSSSPNISLIHYATHDKYTLIIPIDRYSSSSSFPTPIFRSRSCRVLLRLFPRHFLYARKTRGTFVYNDNQETKVSPGVCIHRQAKQPGGEFLNRIRLYIYIYNISIYLYIYIEIYASRDHINNYH